MKEMVLPEKPGREEMFEAVGQYLGDLSLNIAATDFDKPWGGEYYIDESQSNLFLDIFFPGIDRQTAYRFGDKISPKILMVQPGGKLSWQYHDRRAEIWVALTASGIKESSTDLEPEEVRVLNAGEVIQHDSGTRHTLIGLEDWGVIAEIWQHTVENSPSDKFDIVRIKDNYGRAA